MLHALVWWLLLDFTAVPKNNDTACFCLLVWVSHSKLGISVYIVLEQHAWLRVIVSPTTTSSTYTSDDDDDNWWWPQTDTGESLPRNTWSQCICWLSVASSAASTCIESMSLPLVVLPHYVTHVAFFAAAITSRLVLNTCCCRLVSTLDLSKCNRLTWVLDWCISRYVYISIVDDYPSPSTCKLERLDFEHIVWVLGLHFRLMHSDSFFASFVATSVLTPTLCVHMCAWGVCAVSEVVWVVWVLSCSLIGKFSSFFFLQCLLTIYSMFSVISAPISMLGMTLFPLNTFACPHSPQHHIHQENE